MSFSNWLLISISGELFKVTVSAFANFRINSVTVVPARVYGPEHCAACGGKERREKNEGSNPEEVVEDFAMDWEWEKGNELSLDGHLRSLRGERAEMSLRIERLERAMPLGCQESGSGAWRRRMGLVERRLVGEDEDENELSQQEEGAPGDGSVVGKVK